jgi:hypothetical protein
MLAMRIVRTVGVVAAVLVLNDAIARSRVPYGPHEPAGLVGAVLATEVGLCSVWAIIGPGHWIMRLAAVFAVLISVRAFLHDWGSGQTELLPGLWVHTVIMVCALLILRVLGFRLIHGKSALGRELSAPVPRYSIRDIMIVTTFAGIALTGIIRLGSLALAQDIQLISVVVGVFMAAITLAAVLSTLMLRQSVVPALVTCGLGVLLAWGIGTAIHYDRVVATITIGASTGLQVAALLLWRQVGYRFIRPGRAGASTGN